MKYKKILTLKLVKIFFVENLHGSGMTFPVKKDDDKYSILIFNPKVFRQDISEWLTSRENTCFIPGNKMKVKIDAGHKYTGLMGILLHESTHILDEHFKISLSLLRNSKKVKSQYSGILKKIWRDIGSPLEQYQNLKKYPITFYGFNMGPRMKTSQMLDIYSDLAKSPFVSLYGSLNSREDLTELMSWYILVHHYKQRYRIDIYQDSRIIYTEKPFDKLLVKKRIGDVEELLNH